MPRIRKTRLALLVWLLISERPTAATDLLSIKCHLTDEPMAAGWAPETSIQVINVSSETYCASACLIKACIGYSFEGNNCTLEGVGSSIGRPQANLQRFRKWVVNRALFRPVYAYGTAYSGSPASNAVDDRKCIAWSSSSPSCCYATLVRANAWLVIDLGASMRIYVVGVGTVFMKNAEVRVGKNLELSGDFSTYESLGYFNSVASGWMKFSKRSGIEGRYVSLQQLDYANFFVCDVVVLADD